MRYGKIFELGSCFEREICTSLLIAYFTNLCMMFFLTQIWLYVARKLQKRSSDAAESLINSSLFFRNLLMQQRTSFLFEKVFPIMTATIWKKKGIEEFAVSDVLNCRVVCKSWNAAVDKLVPQEFEHFGERQNGNKLVAISEIFTDIQREHEFSNGVLADNDGIDNRSKSSVQTFLRHFERTHTGNSDNERNPWIWSKHLSLNIFAEDNEEVEDYHGVLQGITTMLSKYGCHLQALSIVVESNDFFRNPTLLQKWLRKTPNLETLNFVNESAVPYAQNFNHDEMNDRNSRFPKLRHLREVDISNLPVPFFQKFIRQNTHIHSLFLVSKDEIEYDIYQYVLPNLQNLHLNGCQPNKFVKKFGSSKFQCQIESLELCFDEPVSLAALFKVIQFKCADTLVSLILVFDIPSETNSFWQDCKICRLDLPKLRKITLDFNRSPVCFDFLLPMRLNLEEISASYGYEVPITQNLTYTIGTIIQFVGFEDRMLESNIWTIFKKLDKFEVMQSKESEPQKFMRCDWVLDNLYT